MRYERYISDNLQKIKLHTFCRESKHCFCFNWMNNSGRLYKNETSFITEMIENLIKQKGTKKKFHLYSVFGSKENIRKSFKDVVKIFVTTENIYSPLYNSFSDGCTEFVDLSLTMSNVLSLDNSNHIRFPIGWISRLLDDIRTYDELKRIICNLNKPRSFRNNEICLISRKDDFGTRKIIIDCLRNSGINVTCAGSFMNNSSILKQCSDNKKSCLSHFGFNLCPENTNTDGYCSEKLLESFSSGCIPIYYGSDQNPEPGIFNKDAIIFYNPQDESDFINKMDMALYNKDGYRDFLLNSPVFHNDASEIILSMILNVQSFISELLT